MPRTTKTLTTAAGVWIGGLLVIFSLSACAAGGGDAEAAVVTLTDAGISQQDAEIFTDPEVGDTWCTNFLVQDWTKESDIAHKSAPSPEGLGLTLNQAQLATEIMVELHCPGIE